MDLTGKLIIKVSLGDDIRRIQLDAFESLTYDELILMMQRVFRDQLDANADVTLKYKDEDGDLITLFDSADLAVAISYSRVLKLTIFINGKMSASGKTTNNVVSEDLIKELRGIRNRITEILDTLTDEKGSVTKSEGGIVNGRDATENVDELEGIDGKELRGMKLESKEFDPLQKPMASDDQLSVSSQTSSKVESVSAPPPPLPAPTQQVAPPSGPPSVSAAPATPVMNQPRYPSPAYAMAGYPGGPYPSMPMPTSDVSTKPVNGPTHAAAVAQPGAHVPPTAFVQPPQPGYQPDQQSGQQQQQAHQMQQHMPQATSAAAVSVAGHPQMSAFMGYPQQAPQQQPPPGTSAGSTPGQAASPYAPPRFPGAPPGAIPSQNNPYAAIGGGQRGPTPNFGRYPQAPAYQ